MNKKLLLIAMAGASVLTPVLAVADTNVTVAGADVNLHGRIDLSEDLARVGSARTTHSLQDNTSRLGFTGTKDVGNGLKTQFGLEYGVTADQGIYVGTSTSVATANSAQFRHAYAALMGDFGSVAAGRLDSANPTGSPLYSQVTSSIVFAPHDAGATAIGTAVLNARNRTSNSLGYMTPKFGDAFSVRARYYTSGPENVYNAGTASGVVAENDYKQVDVGFNYNKGPVNAGIGYGSDSKRGGLLANNFKNKWQLVGSYDFGAIKPYAFFGRDKYDQVTAGSRDKANYWLIGAAASLGGPHKLVANVMQRGVQTNTSAKLKKYQAVYEYFLGKETFLFTAFDWNDPNSTVTNDQTKVLSLGIQLNF